MPAVSKKQQNFFRYLLANPDERKKKGISKKDATDFAQDIQEVSPPGWGHTKAEKEKTKPWKPKSKIGGSAAAFKKDLDSGKFKGLPGDKTKKEKTASMFKIMWAAKNKGYKPHYKPGTDEKYKKYQTDEQVGAKSLVMTGQYLKPAIEQEKQKKKKLKEAEKPITSEQDNDLYGNAYERSGARWRISGTPSSKKKKKLKKEEIEMESYELDIEGAVEYFYEQGINEEGLDLLIEEIGLEEFVDFVDETQLLTEAKRVPGGGPYPARKMNVRSLKTAKKKAEEIKADKSDVVKKGTPADTLARARAERAFKKPKLAKPVPKKKAPKPVVKKVEKAVAKVKPVQPKKAASKEGLRAKIKNVYAAGVKRHRKATQPVRVFHKGMKKAPKAVAKAAVDVKRAIAPRKKVKEEVQGGISIEPYTKDTKFTEIETVDIIKAKPLVDEAYKAVTNAPDSLAKMNKRYKPVKKIKNPTDRPFRDRLKDPDYKVDVDEEKKLLPKLKMYRKAGNLARAGDEKSMKRQTKMVSVLNKETEKGYKKAALDKLRDGGSPKHQTEDYKKLPVAKMASKISKKQFKAGQSGDVKTISKKSSETGKMIGVLDTHDPERAKAKSKRSVAENLTFRGWKKKATDVVKKVANERDAGKIARKKLKDKEHHQYVNFLDAPDD